MLIGRFRLKLSRASEDVARIQSLRSQCFRDGVEADADDFDAICQHLLVEEAESGRLLGGCRLLMIESGAALETSYSAQFYDLSRLRDFRQPMLELGRFCTESSGLEAEVLRAAWARLTRLVDERGVGLLLGCSSFHGTDPAPYQDAFAQLGAQHQAPALWAPSPKAPSRYAYAEALKGAAFDPKAAARRMPPLLRSYMQLGGWVSDHAVIDRDLGTLHVFTGLEIGAIPPARARALRLLAGVA